MDKKVDNEKERKAAETERKEKLIIEGNAFYEIDLECMRKKEKREEMEKREREARKPKRFR